MNKYACDGVSPSAFLPPRPYESSSWLVYFNLDGQCSALLCFRQPAMNWLQQTLQLHIQTRMKPIKTCQVTKQPVHGMIKAG